MTRKHTLDHQKKPDEKNTSQMSPRLPRSSRRHSTAFVGSLIVFALTAWLAFAGDPLGWEQTVLRFINEWSSSLGGIMLATTFFGDKLLAALLVVGLFLTGMYRLAWRLAVSIIGAYGAVFIAKELISRERPAALLSDLHVRVTETEMGFPSGHSALVTVVVLTLLPYIPRPWRWVLLALIPIVGLTRLYLGVHWPLDIIGGVAIGVAVVAFLRILPARVRRAVRLD